MTITGSTHSGKDVKLIPWQFRKGTKTVDFRQRRLAAFQRGVMTFKKLRSDGFVALAIAVGILLLTAVLAFWRVHKDEERLNHEISVSSDCSSESGGC